ncbi:hypothetical protein [Mycolicibacterium aichiense]|uniref:Uncharacterized protein n=1 Tax=Mycolicibacterium aichiense TaxID=1799 RepID=A0AAD1M8T8_9MYCO|nr:hypothetical protein [Mycolicibacterium aichiense]MCV7020759.1 hypothetical protein [Mycolicibacterium aichiense]BBX05327.1 hypothetical protein MAIC_01300 [Mycolicibacterium aichiense]STZ25322.1 Uncharacterised protein [Mycolicibacterium aichiense]
MTDLTTDADAADSFAGYAVPAGNYRARRQRGPGYFVTIGLWVIVLVAAMMALSILATRITPTAITYHCPPDCGRPPTGLPVAINPRFFAPDGSFSVSYPSPGTAYDVTIEPNGVRAELTVGEGGTLRLFSEPAKGRNARQVADDLLNQLFPDAVTSYELPNAILGYEPGYGEVADDWPKGTATDSLHQRVIVIVAVKNDLALVAGAVGPFHQFGPDDGPGPPSPANLDIAKDMGKYVNSFMWRGDPPR